MAIYMKDIMERKSRKNTLSFVEALTIACDEIKPYFGKRCQDEAIMWQLHPNPNEEDLQIIVDNMIADYLEELKKKVLFFMNEDFMSEYEANIKLFEYKSYNELGKAIFNSMYNLRKD